MKYLMKLNYKNLLIICLICLISSKCGNEKRVSDIGEHFFAYIDSGKFRDAYSLLTDSDREKLGFNQFLKENKYKNYLSKYIKGDTLLGCFARPFTDSMLETMHLHNIKKLLTVNKLWIVYEKRIISFIPGLSDSNQMGLKSNIIAEALRNGSLAFRKDSSRWAIVLMRGNQAQIYYGAEYREAYRTLLGKYDSFLKNNVSISCESLRIRGRYKTLIAKIKVQNQTRDTIPLVHIWIYMEINDIGASFKLHQNTICPSSEWTGDIICGYWDLDDKSRFQPKWEIKSIDFKTREWTPIGRGPDRDSIMGLQKNLPPVIFGNYKKFPY